MRWIALPLMCVVVAAVGVTAATARTDARALHTATTGPTSPFYTAIGDPIYAGPQAATAFTMTRQAGASYARVFVYWSSVAPATLPVTWNPSDPTHYYNWHAVDATVNAAHAAGITPILNIVGTPNWAYFVPRGSWTGGSPQIGALGAFATAIARHYDGHHSAPAEHVFSVWNEPNFNRNLYPQDPTYYRSMVNAVSDSVHAVNPANLVVAGELAPFKHAPSKHDKNSVIPPLSFMRTMLCLQPACNQKSEFDVWAHHPYSDTGPFGHAKVSGGVELGDLPKMHSLLQQAENLGTIQSAQPVQFWSTEVGWSSNPPNKHGVPMTLEQRWLPESMYQMWKSGVTVGTWFLLQDMPLTTPFQSGLYFRSTSLANAQAKPLLTGFSFPVVAYLKSHGKVLIWGRDTTANSQNVSIQMRKGAGGPWKTVGAITSNNYGIFTATLGLKATTKNWIRAVANGSGSSLPFSLKVPKNENLNVTPFPLNG